VTFDNFADNVLNAAVHGSRLELEARARGRVRRIGRAESIDIADTPDRELEAISAGVEAAALHDETARNGEGRSTNNVPVSHPQSPDSSSELMPPEAGVPMFQRGINNAHHLHKDSSGDSALPSNRSTLSRSPKSCSPRSYSPGAFAAALEASNYDNYPNAHVPGEYPPPGHSGIQLGLDHPYNINEGVLRTSEEEENSPGWRQSSENFKLVCQLESEMDYASICLTSDELEREKSRDRKKQNRFKEPEAHSCGSADEAPRCIRSIPPYCDFKQKVIAAESHATSSRPYNWGNGMQDLNDRYVLIGSAPVLVGLGDALPVSSVDSEVSLITLEEEFTMRTMPSSSATSNLTNVNSVLLPTDVSDSLGGTLDTYLRNLSATVLADARAEICGVDLFNSTLILTPPPLTSFSFAQQQPFWSPASVEVQVGSPSNARTANSVSLSATESVSASSAISGVHPPGSSSTSFDGYAEIFTRDVMSDAEAEVRHVVQQSAKYKLEYFKKGLRPLEVNMHILYLDVLYLLILSLYRHIV